MGRLLHFLKSTGIWAPILVLLFHEFVSVPGWRTWIDWINHYGGGLAFSYFVWKSLPWIATWLGSLTRCGRLAVAFLAGCTAALIWEIGEFISDLVLDTTIQKSIHETMTDIVNGFLGTLTTVAILAFFEFRRRGNPSAPAFPHPQR